MTYKLRSIVPSESDIQSAIIGALVYQQAIGRVVWFGRLPGFRKLADKDACTSRVRKTLVSQQFRDLPVW